jgi:hypothetical protein
MSDSCAADFEVPVELALNPDQELQIEAGTAKK